MPITAPSLMMLLGPLRAHPYCSCSLSRVSTGHLRRPSPILSRAAAADVEWEAPWTAIFDLRERDQFWGDAQQVRPGALPLAVLGFRDTLLALACSLDPQSCTGARQFSTSGLCVLQGALVKAFAARELGLDEDAVERELHKLAALLPDIGVSVTSKPQTPASPAAAAAAAADTEGPVSAGRKVKDLHPSLLSALLRDPEKVAMTLVQLREFLPHANVSQLVARMPALLLKVTCWHAYVC